MAKWLDKIFGRKAADKADFQPDSAMSAETNEMAVPLHLPTAIPLHLSAILSAEERYTPENPVQEENEEMGSAADPGPEPGADADAGTATID